MTPDHQNPPLLWRWMRILNQRIVGNYSRGRGLGPLVLLLTTTGRKSGLPRTTPLQYEQQDGLIYVASARGTQADWFCNLCANPEVQVQIKDRKLQAIAEPITDPERIADFLELRLRRRPLMMRLLLLTEGLSLCSKRADLERFAQKKALVALHIDK